MQFISRHNVLMFSLSYAWGTYMLYEPFSLEIVYFLARLNGFSLFNGYLIISHITMNCVEILLKISNITLGAC